MYAHLKPLWHDSLSYCCCVVFCPPLMWMHIQYSVNTHACTCTLLSSENPPLLLRWFDIFVCMMKDLYYHFWSVTREAQTSPYQAGSKLHLPVPIVGHDSAASVSGTFIFKVEGFGIVFVSILNELHVFPTSRLPANFRQRGRCMKMCYLLSPNYLLFTLLLRTINLSLSIGLGAEFFMR